MVFHWSLSDSKSPQVSRTFLSILFVLNNVLVWMVSTRLPTFKSSSPFNNVLETVQKAQITIGTIVNFMFPIFFQFPSKFEVLILLFISFNFILWSDGTVKSTILQVLFFGDYIMSGRLAEMFVCQNPIGVYVSHSLGQIWNMCRTNICIYEIIIIIIIIMIIIKTRHDWMGKVIH